MKHEASLTRAKEPSLYNPRQTYHEARPATSVIAILDSDHPVMAFDRGLGDGQPQTRVAPKALAIRPHAMKPVKDRLTNPFGNAWAFILDADHHLASDAH